MLLQATTRTLTTLSSLLASHFFLSISQQPVIHQSA
jgi:hypothetical protein